MTTSETAQQGLHTAGLVSHKTDPLPFRRIAQAPHLTVTRTHRIITLHSHCIWTHGWTPSQCIAKCFLQLPTCVPYDLPGSETAARPKQSHSASLDPRRQAEAAPRVQ